MIYNYLMRIVFEVMWKEGYLKFFWNNLEIFKEFFEIRVLNSLNIKLYKIIVDYKIKEIFLVRIMFEYLN